MPKTLLKLLKIHNTQQINSFIKKYCIFISNFHFETELRISSAHISASIIVGAFVFPAMRSGITRMSFQDDHGKIRSR